MTRCRDGKVCNNWLQMKIDDHRILSDYKCKSGLQHPEGKNSVLGIASAWWRCTTTRPTPMTTTWPPRPEHLLHSAHEHWHVKWMYAQFSCLSCSVFVTLDCTSHRVAQVSFVRVISCSSHDERISSTLSPPFPSTSSSSHSSLNLLHFLRYLEGRSNPAYFAWNEMDSLDDSYSLTDPVEVDRGVDRPERIPLQRTTMKCQ